MNNQTIKKRSDMNDKYKWDIASMYDDELKWQEDIDTALSDAEKFSERHGHLMDSADYLLESLDQYCAIMRKVEHAFVYTRMKHDEDNADAKYTGMNNQAMSAIARISANLAFLSPEILESTEETVKKYLSEQPGLEQYRFLLETIMMKKAHVLSTKEEALMATMGEVLGAPSEIFTMLNNADMDFGKVTDDSGNEIDLTHGNYTKLMESESREVRKTVFEKLYNEYKSLNNTISVMYNYNVKEDVISARIRNYGSSLEAALSSEKIPVAVYNNLIDAVHKYLPAMHKYVGIRKRVLGKDKIYMYDMYKPLVKPENLDCTYKEAVDIACGALAPLGEDYVETFRKGVLDEGWVDVYENKGKTSGAYSFGSYDSKPFILMNFSSDLKDVFTLIHEGGHSMHSYYTRKTQPFIYGSHSIFTAEVASTVNETLLINHLLDTAESDEMKIYLINLYIDEFKGTLIRQTMFAEFEKIVHEYVEQGGSLTAKYLNKTYDDLNTMYFGPDLTHDDMIQYEWSRIPHFYRSFYVYQYATGYSAANALATGILEQGKSAADRYLKFLTLGDSGHPIDLLKVAGVDMSSEEPVLTALKTFSDLIDKLDELI